MYKHKTMIKNLIVALLINSVTFLFSTAQPLSMSDAIELALKNNYQIQIAEKQVDLAKNNNNLGTAGRYPVVNFTLSPNNRLSVNNNPASFLNGTFSNIGATVGTDVSWVLFNGFKVDINKARLEEIERQSIGNSEVIIENTIQAVILAYYRALIEQEKKQVLQQSLQLSKDRLDYEELKRELGTGGTFDVLQVKNNYLSDSVALVLQQNILDVQLQNLKLAMGIDEQANYVLTDKLGFEQQSYEYANLEERMLANNKNLQNQYINVEILKKDVELAKSNIYPRISANTGFTGGVSRFQFHKLNLPDGATLPPEEIERRKEPVVGKTFDYYLNFSLSFNIFNGGNTRRAIQNAQINQKIGELSIEDLKRNMNTQLENTLTTYNNQLQLVKLNEELISNASLNLSLAEDRFKSGLINSFNYRDIQLAQIRASRARLESIFKKLLSKRQEALQNVSCHLLFILNRITIHQSAE